MPLGAALVLTLLAREGRAVNSDQLHVSGARTSPSIVNAHVSPGFRS